VVLTRAGRLGRDAGRRPDRAGDRGRELRRTEGARAEVKGRIVLFDVPFDQDMADRGLAGQAYGAGSNYRTNGPRMAAEMGAAAALVRSVGGANYRCRTPAPRACRTARAFRRPPSRSRTRC
jgi:hypothetical protein